MMNLIPETGPYCISLALDQIFFFNWNYLKINMFNRVDGLLIRTMLIIIVFNYFFYEVKNAKQLDADILKEVVDQTNLIYSL